MSGIKRNILAEIVADGKSTLKEVQKAFSPEKIRTEKGRSNLNGSVVKGEDAGKYIGKMAQDR